MVKYINVENYCENICRCAKDKCDKEKCPIHTAPAADVVEVKYGRNISPMNPVDEFACSECGFTCADYAEVKYDEDGDYTYFCECEFDYCPRCGAKMDRGE